jgi:hypothetical protein
MSYISVRILETGGTGDHALQLVSGTTIVITY